MINDDINYKQITCDRKKMDCRSLISIDKQVKKT